MREVARPCQCFSGPVVDQPNCPRTPPGVGERQGGPLVSCARGRRHTRKREARAVGLLCSPNAHARSIVFAESRCSSKRAVGDQSALPRRENERAWKDHWNGPSNIASRHRLGDHNDRAMHPPQVAETPPSTSVEGKKRRPISPARRENEQALEGSIVRRCSFTRARLD